MDVDAALDRLYSAPLEEFTSTRNSLSNELADSGDKDGAQTLKALKKPNLAAWALNQLVRNHAKEIDELYQATEELRRAQRRVMSGGKGAALREATDARGRTVAKLTKLAAQILTDAGHAAAQSTLSAISDSLVAVGASPDSAELLRSGRLTRELHAESVVDVGRLTLVEGEAEPEADEPTADRTQAISAARTAVNEARDRVQEAKKALREAEAEIAERTREADEAERAAKAAREAAEFARRASEARRTEVEEAERLLGEARAALDEIDR